MQPNASQYIVDPKPLFDPTYLNLEYFFDKALAYADPALKAITNAKTWETIGIISICISMLAIFIIIYSLVRMYEIQVFDKEEIEHEINHALARDKERERNLNPRWKYILTLIESPNENDWRVAIMESDSLLEESFKDKGLVGDTMSDLLEEARANGYRSVQNAWDAHVIRNKIAHEGIDYPLTQVEARRILQLYQNVFEDMQVI